MRDRFVLLTLTALLAAGAACNGSNDDDDAGAPRDGAAAGGAASGRGGSAGEGANATAGSAGASAGGAATSAGGTSAGGAGAGGETDGGAGGVGAPCQGPACRAARQAGAFVASVGVNTHLEAPAYAPHYEAIRDLIVGAKIGSVRDGGSSATFAAHVRELAGLGTKTVYIANPRYGGVRPTADYWSDGPGTLLVDYLKQIGPGSVAAVEVMNEIDLNYQSYHWHPGDAAFLDNNPGSPNYWVTYTRAIAASTYDVVKGDAATAVLPIYGPSLTSTDAYAAVGDLSASVDYSNIHWYQGGFFPETTGWGGNGYGSAAWALTYLARVQAPSKPVVATEGGYDDDGGKGQKSRTPVAVEGRYMPRLLLHAFEAGVTRFLKYELLDEGTDPTNAEDNFGLLNHDLSPKPAFVAIKNLLGLLADPGPSFAPGALALTITGDTANVQSSLLRKRNGTFYLALWVGASSFDPNTLASTAVASRQVSVALPTWATSVTVRHFDERGALSEAAATVTAPISLTIDDKVTVVEIGG